ncbi:ATP-binding cassette domain-containing protein [Hyperthermus butylicus]|uniref:ATP-binding cassette domain-containing protein n=1 Tax=Hyperthermus butylicus TaxID=54248 RepID=UPI00068DC592|nr:ATP-binding cassette domain-containing protein [Hyperthermus butylicus]
MTVYDFLSSRALFTRRWPRLSEGSDVKEKLYDVLRRTGLTRDVLGKRLWELSGGVLMRVFIARTLLYDPIILLLDEPLAPIDPHGKIEFSYLLGEISKTKLVNVTSHDPCCWRNTQML